MMTDAAIERTERVRPPARRAFLGSMRELALLPAIAVLFVVGIFTSPAFFTASNFSNTAQFSAALGMVVVAESLILLTGSFDLSLQSVYGLAPMIGAWLIVPKDAQGLGTNWNPAVGILVVLAIGAAVGLFNGFMIVKLRFNAFIFTLAMLILLAGLQQGIVSGRTIYGMPHSYIYLGSAYWGGFPVSAWVTLGVFIVAGLFPPLPRAGRPGFAIGGHPRAGRAGGRQVRRLPHAGFPLSGALAA